MIGEQTTNHSHSKDGKTAAVKVRTCVGEEGTHVLYTVDGKPRVFSCWRRVWEWWRESQA